MSLDITGINILWKDYDVSALPLNTTLLSEKKEGSVTVKECYFDGHLTVDGRIRAYIKVLEAPDATGVVLFMSDCHGNTDAAYELNRRGYTVAILDYMGRSSARYTLYPQSLAACNIRDTVSFQTPEDALYSNWYIWTCIARRAVKQLGELYPDKKLFALGVELGGSIVYKLSVFDDGLTACTTLLNILPDVTGTGNQMINYRAALDNMAYAPSTKIPLMMAICSNDEDGSLDNMSELAESSSSLVWLRILERSFSAGIKNAYDQVANFFRLYVNGEAPNISVNIKAVNSEERLYFNIDVAKKDSDGERIGEKVELFTSFYLEDPRNRNWTKMSLIGLAGNEYMTRVEVMKDDKPIYAFVNVTDADGNVISSTLHSVTAKSLNIPAQVKVQQRLIFDSSSGIDVWTSPDGCDVTLQDGPLGIKGVTCASNTLATFKPGDALYKANKDSLLQIILSGARQDVKIIVSDGDDTYFCTVTLPNDTDWNKFTLSHSDFKSMGGQLNDWSKIVMLQFIATDKLLVSSMLWV